MHLLFEVIFLTNTIITRNFLQHRVFVNLYKSNKNMYFIFYCTICNVENEILKLNILFQYAQTKLFIRLCFLICSYYCTGWRSEDFLYRLVAQAILFLVWDLFLAENLVQNKYFITLLVDYHVAFNCLEQFATTLL